MLPLANWHLQFKVIMIKDGNTYHWSYLKFLQLNSTIREIQIKFTT